MKRFIIFLQGCLLLTLMGGFVFGQGWKVDQKNAKVAFEIGSIHGKVKGKFSEFEAQVTFDPNKLVGSSISGKIKVGSIDTGSKGRDKSLLGKKYFDPEEFPYMAFSSKKIVKEGNGYVAYGTLSIKGKSREFKLPFSFEDKLFKASFELKFTDYGVSGGGLFHEDEAKVILELGAVSL